MIEYIPEIINSGITSLKIEGRVKNELYVATVIKAYRNEIDAYYNDKENYKINPENISELEKISYRGYTTGFFNNKPQGTEQVYDRSTYIQNYQTTAVVKEYIKEEKCVVLEQRNRFFAGDEIEFLMPKGKNRKFKIEKMYDIDGNEISVAPHPQMLVKIYVDFEVEEYSIIRTKVN